MLACLPLLATACSGGSSAASKDAAIEAKEACQVFAGFQAPTESGRTAQIDYAKASYVRFLKSADLASRAAQEDPRWKPLQSAAQREAAAFEVIVKAADPHASADVSSTSVKRAVADSTAARPVFVAQCEKADPSYFKPSASPTQ